MMNFDNTDLAFRSKSNTDLTRAYLLFKTIGSNTIVKIGSFAATTAVNLHLPVMWAAGPTIYSQFVGGESINKCKKAVRHLEKNNVGAILDYSVEGKESLADIKKALEETLHSIKNAGQDANIPFAVFKPTAFTRHDVLEKASTDKASMTEAEKAEAENFRSRVETLCKAAYEANIPILIDAEDTFFQHFIDEVVLDMMTKYNKESAIVFNTYQMYRWDRLALLQKDYDRAVKEDFFLGAKFVRGAYMEKERARAAEKGYKDPIQPDKESTDKDYNAALKFCIEHIDRISIFNGTHNEYSSAYLAQLMEEKGIAKDDKRIFFSQLYGMSDHISFIMAANGYNVAKYLPYGPVRHVLPYLLRRVEENTSVAGQTSRELSLLQTERKRRKNK